MCNAKAARIGTLVYMTPYKDVVAQPPRTLILLRSLIADGKAPEGEYASVRDCPGRSEIMTED